MSDRGVHISHCCLRHGCKYGDPSCSVETGNDKQEFPCESCMEEEHLTIVGFHHWMGFQSLPLEVLNLIKHEDGYLLPWDILAWLTEKYDVQLAHVTIQLGNHEIKGLRLMLDDAGEGHRQR